MAAKHSLKKEISCIVILSVLYFIFMIYVLPLFLIIGKPLQYGEGTFYVLVGLIIIWLGIRKFIIKIIWG